MKTTPKIIELVGPAGAGKSTLAQALEQCSANVARRFPPYWRAPREFPFFAKNTLASVPTFARLMVPGRPRRLSREEIASIIIVHGWPRALRRPAEGSEAVFFIDQGAISMLTVPRVRKGGLLSGPEGTEWQRSMLRGLAHVLDMVIWLDAPNSVLLPRIRARRQQHGIKRVSDARGFQILDTFRDAYESAFSIMTDECPDFRVLRLNTGELSIDQECDVVRSALGLRRGEQNDGIR